MFEMTKEGEVLDTVTIDHALVECYQRFTHAYGIFLLDRHGKV